jgi:hypothetical protein
MKKLFFSLAVSTCILACNNSGNTSTTKDTAATSPTNVENVNGNVPDTASGMNLNHSLPIDSSRMKDSAKH